MSFRRLFRICGGDRYISRDLRVNHAIRARDVRLIDDEGQQLGILPVREALSMAAERGLDLVEVAPTANPVVCRIMDYGRFKYEQDKREREARKKQHVMVVKELVMRPNIDQHDLGIRIKQAEAFLREGHKVKLTMRFRGREIVHVNLGIQSFRGVADALAAVGQVETPPRQEGRTLGMVLAPRPEIARAAAARHVGEHGGADGSVASRVSEDEGSREATDDVTEG